MSCRCMPPSNGSFMHVHVAGADPVAVVVEQRLHRRRDRAEVEGHADRLRDRSALAVADDGGEVHPVADDGRVRGPADRRRHLVRHRRERVADDLERDRVDAGLSRHRAPGRASRSRRRAGLTTPAGRRRSCRTRPRAGGRAQARRRRTTRVRTGTAVPSIQRVAPFEPAAFASSSKECVVATSPSAASRTARISTGEPARSLTP